MMRAAFETKNAADTNTTTTRSSIIRHYRRFLGETRFRWGLFGYIDGYLSNELMGSSRPPPAHQGRAPFRLSVSSHHQPASSTPSLARGQHELASCSPESSHPIVGARRRRRRRRGGSEVAARTQGNATPGQSAAMAFTAQKNSSRGPSPSRPIPARRKTALSFEIPPGQRLARRRSGSGNRQW